MLHLLRCIPLSQLVKDYPWLANISDLDPDFTWGDCEYSLIHPHRLINLLKDSNNGEFLDETDAEDIPKVIDLIRVLQAQYDTETATDSFGHTDGVLYIDLEN